MEHQASTISLSFFGNRAFHKLASDLHANRALRIVVPSFLKTLLFLLFQMCQQHSSKKVPKCLLGTCIGGSMPCSLWTSQSTPVWIWTALQNSFADAQPKITWAGVSSAAWQTSHNNTIWRPTTGRQVTQYFCSPGVHLCTDKLCHRLCRPTLRWFLGVTLKSLAPQGTPRKVPQDTTLKWGNSMTRAIH
jgi:hypothetical protein